MLIIGLTGGIATGKNFVSNLFSRLGAKVFDADFEVHNLFCKNKKIIKRIAEIFPQSLNKQGFIDRQILRELILKEPKNIKILEEIIHPQIRESEVKFLKVAQYQKRKIVVLNIPLLLEAENIKPALRKKRINLLSKNKTIRYKISCAKNNLKSHKRFDFIISIIAPTMIRQNRFLRRDLTKNIEFFNQAKKNQISDLQRRKHSNFLLNNGLRKSNTAKQVQNIYQKLTSLRQKTEVLN